MSAKKPIVSVVILCRDGELLQGSLDSVHSQTFPSIEIIVVGKLREADRREAVPAVQYFGEVDEPQAWNFGASRAAGEYLCFLQSGEQLLPTCIEKCVFLAENAGLGLCTAGARPGSQELDSQRSGATASQVLVIRRTAFELVRGFDARVGPDAQSSDMWIRFAKAGIRTSVLPEILVITFGRPEVAPRAHANRASTIPDIGREQFSYATLLAEQARRQPTILLAMPFLTVGGAEAVVSQICRQLNALGFRLVVISTVPVREAQGDTTPWFEESAAGIYHLPQFLHVSRWPAFICYLIQQYSVDAIWQLGSTFLYDLLPNIRQLFPQMVVVDQLFNQVGHTANYLKYSYLIDHVITEHGGMKDWLLEHGETEERISVIPNGVNLDWYSPQPRVDWRTGQPRRPDDGRFVVGFVGRLSEEKGPDLFVEIASQLGDRADVEFVICGGGPMESRLRADVAAKGLSARVHFLGFVDLRAGHRPCCDALVVCSRLDGRPNAVMEGLAMGLPVIASRVGGIPEMMPTGSGGELCEPGDVIGFSNAIRALVEDPHLYRRRCAEARTHAERHFSFAEAGKRYAAIFENAREKRAALARPASVHSDAMLSGMLPFVPKWPAPNSRFRVAWRILCILLVPSRLVITWRNALRYRSLKAAATDHFDAAFYLRMNPDVAMSGIPPLFHYIFLGFLEGRDPSAEFSSTDYFVHYPDLERSGVNPLLHYLASGKAATRAFSD